MKNLNKMAMAALLTGVVGTANAQYPGAECGCPDLASRQEVLVSTLLDGTSNFTTNQVWDCTKMYILDQAGPAYVNGTTLTIGAGTVIKAEDGTGANASSLVVTRGSKIFANGTESCKIIFTSVNDINVDGSFAITNTAQWGGLLVLGRAKNNLINTNSLSTGQDGEGKIEGLVAVDSRNFYGVADGTPNGTITSAFINDDNSGVIRHVSLRYGGTVIGANNEINGLTLGSVGSGTVLEHIEIVSNEDDGIEFFGGTANIKYASVLFCQDDYFDVDQAYSGNMQFLFALQSNATNSNNGILGDHILELDGEDGAINAPDKGNARIFNVTGIANGANDPAVEIKEEFNGTVANSIFVNTPIGVRFSADTEDNFLTGETVEVYNNSFDAVATLVTPATSNALFTANANITEAGVLPDFAFNYTSINDVVVPVPAEGTAGNASFDVYPGIDPVNYRGAFAPGQTPWIAGGFLDTAFDGIGNLPNFCRSDLNGDGLINGLDFGIFGSDFNTGSCN